MPLLKSLKCPAAASTRHSGHKQFLLPSVVRAFKPAVCAYNVPRQLFASRQATALLLSRAFKPPVGSPQTPETPKNPKMLRGPLLLGRSSLPFASRQMLKMSSGSFDQALWPQAFLVRALKPAVCLHGPLPLGRSSLPFASRQMPKMSCGSFHPALRPLPSFVKGLQAVTPLPSVLRAFKPAVCQPSGHCFSYPGARRCRRPFRKSFRVLGFHVLRGSGWEKKW